MIPGTGSGIIGPALMLLSWGAISVMTVVALVRGWRDLLDEHFTAADQRLAMSVGILLLTPAGVFAHELGHAVVALQLGARDVAINYFVYWGSVSYRAVLDSGEQFLIAAAGPLAGAVLGLVALAAAPRVQKGVGEVLRHFGLWAMLINLVFYPTTLLTGFVGDFHRIYSSATPLLSAVAALVHIACLAAAVVLYRSSAEHFKDVDRVAVILGTAMEPTLASGSRLFYRTPIGTSVYGRSVPAIRRGDVVAHLVDESHYHVRRVVAIPGDVVEVQDGRLTVNGERVEEPYVAEPMEYSVSGVRLGDSEYYVLGDNRNQSEDSHVHGPVTHTQILGVAYPVVLC